MADPQKLEQMLYEARDRQIVLREIQAVLLAELALLSPDASAKLEGMLAQAEAAFFAAYKNIDLTKPHARAIAAGIEKSRDEIFEQAREALRRLQKNNG